MSADPAAVTKIQFRADPEHSGTLPPHYYFSDEVYEREKENIWFRTWQYVGLLEELRNPGDYITAEIIDQQVVVVRNRAGELRAYYNVCMHRGHILVEGKGNRTILTCPFHAWSYDLDGNLKAAGNAENVAGFDLDDFGLTPIRVEAFGPMVFVNLSEEGSALYEMAGGLLDSMRAAILGFDDLKWVRTDTWSIDANWKFQADGLECYHCPIIHPQIMGSDDGYLDTSWDSKEEEYWQEHIIHGNYELIDGQKDKLLYDFGDAVLRDVYIWYLWPNLIFVTHQGPPNIKLLHSQATGSATSRRAIIGMCPTSVPTPHDLAHMDNYAFGVFPQDKDAMELQAAGVRSRGYQGGRLMVDAERSWRSEHGTHHFDNLVWQALNGDNYG